MLSAPLVEPSAPELGAHQRGVRANFLKTTELVIDVGTSAEVHGPNKVIKTIVKEVAGPVTLEEGYLVESDRAQAIAYFTYVCLVNSV